MRDHVHLGMNPFMPVPHKRSQGLRNLDPGLVGLHLKKNAVVAKASVSARLKVF